MKKLIWIVLVLSFLLSSCESPPPTSPNGYEVVLFNGDIETLHYQYCQSYTNSNLYAVKRALFVRCGHWSDDRNSFDLHLIVEYEAQIISFKVKD